MLVALNLNEDDVLELHRICSQHFQNSDTIQVPLLHLGAQLAHRRKLSHKDARFLVKQTISHCKYEPSSEKAQHINKGCCC